MIVADIRDIKPFNKRLKDVILLFTWFVSTISFELDPDLSRTINFDCFEPMVQAARVAGVKRFIYVLQSFMVSVKPRCYRRPSFVPLTDYNKYKGLCEPILFKYQTPDLARSSSGRLRFAVILKNAFRFEHHLHKSRGEQRCDHGI